MEKGAGVFPFRLRCYPQIPVFDGAMAIACRPQGYPESTEEKISSSDPAAWPE